MSNPVGVRHDDQHRGRIAPFQLEGRVAVITGAANGLGLAIARACAQAGMKLVLADIDSIGAEAASRELAAITPSVWACTDVRDRSQLDRLADLAFDTFGAVDVLFNNAGVVIARPLMETTQEDWQWILQVNLWSVIHGIAAFVPRMLAQNREGRIVNTASAAGFISESTLAAYCASKHAVVTLSESLHQELAGRNARLGVTILCPAFVPTRITDSERARPAELAGPRELSPAAREAQARLEKAVRSGRLSADDVARMTLSGVRERLLYVFPHEKIREAIQQRLERVYASFDALRQSK